MNNSLEICFDKSGIFTIINIIINFHIYLNLKKGNLYKIPFFCINDPSCYENKENKYEEFNFKIKKIKVSAFY